VSKVSSSSSKSVRRHGSRCARRNPRSCRAPTDRAAGPQPRDRVPPRRQHRCWVLLQSPLTLRRQAGAEFDTRFLSSRRDSSSLKAELPGPPARLLPAAKP
jgi:hypothetical protein